MITKYIKIKTVYVQKGHFDQIRLFLDRYKAISGHTIGSFRAEKRIFEFVVTE